MKSYDKVFLTGCDESTEWTLPWFLENYFRYNSIPILVANFGMSENMLKFIEKSPVSEVIDMSDLSEKGWFKKPKSMIRSSMIAGYTCWIDTDIEILADISDIFNYVEPNKLGMVEDKPWSKRRNETWHNSGVVAFKDSPQILHQWAYHVEQNPQVGDQEVLHSLMTDPLTRLMYIKDVPNEYNWLRIQLLDGQDSNKKKTIHWTGRKGKEHIRSLIKNV